MNCLTQPELEKTLNPDYRLPLNWEQHLASCTTCQRQLETMAGFSAEWESVCVALQQSATDFDTNGNPVDCVYDSTIFYRMDWESGPVDNKSGNNIDDPASPADLPQEFPHFEAPSHPENLGRLGRYELEHPVGQGGMGIVFKGFDVELNRPVAIKILSPHLSGHGAARQRFTREAKSAAAVVHDHVVPIFDIQSDHPQPYLVMPFVNGFSLEEYVTKRGQLSTRNILQVGLQIASGLTAAHAQGLIHRDIKPANILLENGLNRVQITDFGLARAVDDAAMTHSGMIAGTPHYMSPEQATGSSLDHRSDLFSLGCVMYFMATGRTLYRGQSPFSIIAQLARGNYTPVREINTDIPIYVQDIIDKLLEHKPQDRFQSAEELVQHLKQALAYLQQPTSRKPPRRLWNSRKKKTLSRCVWATACSLVLFSVVFATMKVWSSDGTPTNSNPANLKSPPAGVPTETGPQVPPVVLPTWNDLDQELADIDQQLNALEAQFLPDHTPPAQLPKDLWDELQQLEQSLTPGLIENQTVRGIDAHGFPPSTQNGWTSEPETFTPSMEKED